MSAATSEMLSAAAVATSAVQEASSDSSYDSAESHSGYSAGPFETGGSSPSVPRDQGCPTD
eukprot:6490629-Amphidinium_carterae.1